MSRLELFENHEVMNIASEMMQREFKEHEFEGGQYDDEKTKKIASRVILTCMPHIMEYMHHRVVVEAETAHVIDPDKNYFDVAEGLHVDAKFKHVEFQPINQELIISTHGSLVLEEYDLFAVVRPQFVDPEPGEIILGDEVMVPFSKVSMFKPSI